MKIGTHTIASISILIVTPTLCVGQARNVSRTMKVDCRFVNHSCPHNRVCEHRFFTTTEVYHIVCTHNISDLSK